MARPRKSRRIIISVDRQAPRIRRPCDDRIPLDAERRPHGLPEEKLSGPCFLKPFSASHAWTCRRQPQHPVAKRPDRAARMLDIGFPTARRVQEGDLDGYDLAGGGLNGRNHAGKGTLRLRAVVAVRRQIADCRGWVRRKTALAQEDGHRRALRICRCAPKPTCIIGGGLGRPSIVEAAKNPSGNNRIGPCRQGRASSQAICCS
jgi:hypothetical protein